MLLPDGLPDEISGPAFVIDGDSIEVFGSTIRLSGIDAPEARQTCRVSERTIPCGIQAAETLRERIAASRVVCKPNGRDKYSRYLAECFRDGISLNRWMVEQGWAVAFGSYAAEEAAARVAGRGLWRGTFERPADWRKRHGV